MRRHEREFRDFPTSRLPPEGRCSAIVQDTVSKGRSALAAPLSAGLVMVVIAGIAPKAAGALRLWAPVIGAVAGSGVVAIQRVSWRRPWAADFRAVQGAITVDGLGNVLSGLAGTTPNTATTVGASMTEFTGVGARSVGTAAGAMFVAVAFLPKVLAVVLAIPGTCPAPGVQLSGRRKSRLPPRLADRPSGAESGRRTC